MTELYTKRDVVEKYDKGIAGYPAVIHDSITDFVKQHNKSNKGDQKFDLMIDAGCGNGRSTVMFVEDFKKIVGFDASSEQIRIAKSKNAFDNIEYVEARECTMPASDNSVDLITCGFAIQYMNVEKFVQECRRVLKPNGVVVLYAFETCDILHKEKTTSAMPVLMTFLDEMKSWAKEHYPPDYEYFCRYENVFKKISGMTKTRKEILGSSMFISLAELIAIISAVPGHGMFVDWMKENESRDTLNELGCAIKSSWGLEKADDSEVKIEMKLAIYTINLTK